MDGVSERRGFFRERWAGRRSSWPTAVGVLSAVTCMVFRIDNVWTANLLLPALSEVLGFVLRLAYDRRGF